MKEKWEKINHIVAFTFFMIIIVILFSKVSWVFRSNDRGARERIVGFHNEGDIDVVLYGGSNVFRYYQPMEVWRQKGYTSYNYATSSAKADLLKEYIEESRLTNEAKVYVCDIRAIPMLQDTIIVRALRNWSDSLPVFSPVRVRGITSFLFTRNWKDEDITSYYVDIANYHSNYEVLGDSYQWSYVDTENIESIDKGFEARERHKSFTKPEVSNERGKLTEQQKNALLDLLDYCDKEKLEVLFVVCPYIITEYDWQILNTCGDIIESRGYSFINFNHYYDEIGLDFETDFGDTNHVNYLGAEKYTPYLANYILEHYELPDHREDAAYAKWNDDYAAYTAMQENWKESINLMVSQHIEARELGNNLKNMDDFASWYDAIQNDNFTIIVEKNKELKGFSGDISVNKMLSDWGIDITQSTYIGLWTGNECLFSSNETETFKKKIGVDSGWGKTECNLSVDENPQILIGDVNYYNDVDGIQIVVFDNNDQKVVDNVTIWADETDGVEMIRF